jgi:hypothetical protein
MFTYLKRIIRIFFSPLVIVDSVIDYQQMINNQHISAMNNINLEITRLMNFINYEHVSTRDFITNQLKLPSNTSTKAHDELLEALKNVHSMLAINEITLFEKQLLSKRIAVQQTAFEIPRAVK